MLAIDISVVDGNGKRRIVQIKAVRGAQHPRLHNAFYYEYQGRIDDDRTYNGVVIHSYNNGPVALTAKISRAITMQQKADRKAK